MLKQYFNSEEFYAVQKLQKLSPFIVESFQCSDVGSKVVIQQEFINGGNLSKLLKKDLTETQIKRIFYQILLGLESVHKTKLVHRDIKGENILLMNPNVEDEANIDNLIVKTDFGFARELNAAGIEGTLPYMAPEIFERKSITPNVDMWAAGVLLYIMFTRGKKYPFTGNSLTDFNNPVHHPLPRPTDHQIPDWAWGIIARCLIVSSTQRATASMLAALPCFGDVRPDVERIQAKFRADREREERETRDDDDDDDDDGGGEEEHVGEESENEPDSSSSKRS